MPKKRASGEEIVAHFDSYPKAAGNAEKRVAVTAKYFKIKPETVKKHLRFWWPGKKYLKEFEQKEKTRVYWDRPTNDLLEAMNRHGSVAKAAKALKTTPMTLAKALQRHQIEHRWVLAKPALER